MVKKIFDMVSFPAKFDTAMYVNSRELSNMFDVNELQLTLSLSHLVQQNILISLTPLYTTFKVGKIDEKKLVILLNTLNSDTISAAENPSELNSETAELLSGYDDEESTNEELIIRNKRKASLVTKIAEYVRANGKRKWCSINAVSLANDNSCQPSDIVACVGKIKLFCYMS